jgi:Mlc titration factor MtfA (ptsG expression regulator)/Tfp pilus assembly protein PilF
MFNLFETKKSRRQRLLAEPFPETWRTVLQQNVFLYRLLSEPEQHRLRDAVRIFIAEKYWEGCRGQEITDEVQVIIAAQACLLLLGFEDYYFDDVQTVLVYPGGFLVNDLDPSREDRVSRVSGMAVAEGPVLVSWWDARWEARWLGQGSVVIHEMAHKLGQLHSPETAVPFLSDPERQKRWRKVLRAELRRLREDADYDRPTLLDPYGAGSLAEFFAVASECFFLEPLQMRSWHPKLYRALAGWYNQDPAQRRQPTLPERRAAAQAEAERDRHEIAECGVALRLRPGYREAHLTRAVAYWRLGQPEQALADYDAVLGRDPDDVEILCERGVTHRELGHDDAAVADFTRAHELMPEFARPLFERGLVQAQRGDDVQALADLDAALALDPRDDATLIARARVHLARGDNERALADLAAALELWPWSADAHGERARVRLQTGHYDEAVADCDRALEIDPDFAEAYCCRASALVHKGDYDRAIADCDAAIELDPDCEEAHEIRARAQSALDSGGGK